MEAPAGHPMIAAARYVESKMNRFHQLFYETKARRLGVTVESALVGDMLAEYQLPPEELAAYLGRKL